MNALVHIIEKNIGTTDINLSGLFNGFGRIAPDIGPDFVGGFIHRLIIGVGIGSFVGILNAALQNNNGHAKQESRCGSQ